MLGGVGGVQPRGWPLSRFGSQSHATIRIGPLFAVPLRGTRSNGIKLDFCIVTLREHEKTIPKQEIFARMPFDQIERALGRVAVGCRKQVNSRKTERDARCRIEIEITKRIVQRVEQRRKQPQTGSGQDIY